MIEKIKKFTKMMIDEIQSANDYIDMGIKMNDTDYRDMAKEELHHKDVLMKTLEKSVEEANQPQMDNIFEFVEEIIDDMANPIVIKIESM